MIEYVSSIDEEVMAYTMREELEKYPAELHGQLMQSLSRMWDEGYARGKASCRCNGECHEDAGRDILRIADDWRAREDDGLFYDR